MESLDDLKGYVCWGLTFLAYIGFFSALGWLLVGMAIGGLLCG